MYEPLIPFKFNVFSTLIMQTKIEWKWLDFFVLITTDILSQKGSQVDNLTHIDSSRQGTSLNTQNVRMSVMLLLF